MSFFVLDVHAISMAGTLEGVFFAEIAPKLVICLALRRAETRNRSIFISFNWH